MKKDWYKKWFNTGDYLDLYKHRDSADAAGIAGLVKDKVKLPKGSNILDVACGNGRHSRIFAKEGYNVLGIDLSPFLINEAKKELKKSSDQLKDRMSFEIRDMRNLRYKKRFDLVINLFSSFGYFEDDKDNLKVIKGISASLKQGGYFFFDYLNPDALRKNLVPFDISIRNHNVILQVRTIKGNSVYKDIAIVKNSKTSRTPVVSSFNEMIKLYGLKDFKVFFARYGLKILKTFGDYSGSRFNSAKSERLIILAVKK